MKLSVFDRIVTIVPGIDKNASVEDVFEHVINGVRVLFLRKSEGQHDSETRMSDETPLRAS